MRVRCPHCYCPLEIVADKAVAEIICPSCGSSLDGINETLVSIRSDVKSLGRFQLIERVGRGYFGEVWKARDSDLRRTVALKIPRSENLSEEDHERFLREAKTTAQLRHPNIVPVHEVGREDGTLFIVSDFIDGMTLAERIAINRPAPREAAELCVTVAMALHYAHESGVIHRDFKPSNVMLDQTGKPYLLDFGLAKQESGEFTMTASGDVLGTPAYMSPEQARGDSHTVDRRTDIYSMGVVLYELLTGERPFRGSTHLLLKAIQQTEPSPPSKINRQLPRDLETICLKAMSKEPHRRYATALELAEDLQRFLHGQAIKARRVSSFEHGWRWVRRNSYLSAACAVAGIAILSLIGVLSSKSATAPVMPEVPPRTVAIDTIPTGATIVFYPLSTDNGEPLYDQAIEAVKTTPVTVELKPYDYLVVAVSHTEGYGFHEVYRRVPPDDRLSGTYFHESWQVKDGIIVLPVIKIPHNDITDGMVSFDGADDFEAGSKELPEATPYRVRVPPFLMDPTEVTVGQLKMLIDPKGGHPEPLLVMPDKSAPDDSPATHVSFPAALHLAERMGKRLPTEFEYEFAATDSGRHHYPWGNDPEVITEWSFGVVGSTMPWDVLPTVPPVLGLYSNVSEWTSSWVKPYPTDQFGAKLVIQNQSEHRIVRGGSASVITGKPQPDDWSRGPRTRVAAHLMTYQPSMGFRCVKSKNPRIPRFGERK